MDNEKLKIEREKIIERQKEALKKTGGFFAEFKEFISKGDVLLCHM